MHLLSTGNYIEESIRLQNTQNSVQIVTKTPKKRPKSTLKSTFVGVETVFFKVIYLTSYGSDPRN
jgi:hypothetical protein